MSQEIVIFDIDGTLADASNRQHHVRKVPPDWDAFFENIAEDKVITSVVRLCEILYKSGVRIVLFTGRPQKFRRETIEWLAKEGINYHDLFMREDEDRRDDVVVKREMLQKVDRTKILFVVEDRSRVVRMWRSAGLVCLQCAPGDF